MLLSSIERLDAHKLIIEDDRTQVWALIEFNDNTLPARELSLFASIGRTEILIVGGRNNMHYYSDVHLINTATCNVSRLVAHDNKD